MDFFALATFSSLESNVLGNLAGEERGAPTVKFLAFRYTFMSQSYRSHTRVSTCIEILKDINRNIYTS